MKIAVTNLVLSLLLASTASAAESLVTGATRVVDWGTSVSHVSTSEVTYISRESKWGDSIELIYGLRCQDQNWKERGSKMLPAVEAYKFAAEIEATTANR